ncbi:unnamed protein product [Sphagnum jensenii]|uniref:Uncharacterized protein n=1 Tax=Sphagnum jensenii TaxID=128206 RepID=A0ABP1AVI1_9BRYO
MHSPPAALENERLLLRRRRILPKKEWKRFPYPRKYYGDCLPTPAAPSARVNTPSCRRRASQETSRVQERLARGSKRKLRKRLPYPRKYYGDRLPTPAAPSALVKHSIMSEESESGNVESPGASCMREQAEASGAAAAAKAE